MSIEYKSAPSLMAGEYIELRGQTRENSITADTLRSYGFYRHLGWQSTGALDMYGDEILEFACR
jgi:hypothetical protein